MLDLALLAAVLTSIKTATDIAKGLREADLSLELSSQGRPGFGVCYRSRKIREEERTSLKAKTEGHPWAVSVLLHELRLQ